MRISTYAAGWRLGWVVALWGLTVVAAGQNNQGLVLVRDGQGQGAIVVAAQANPKASGAAQELQRYLERISGARLPIVTDQFFQDAPEAGVRICVGPSSLTEAAGVQVPSGLTPERREEGFVIVSRPGLLVLAGNDAGPYHGTEYAVYDFLHRLGVRWYMPTEFGEIIPERATITVPLVEVEQRPDFILRDWWSQSPMSGVEDAWKLRNKMNPSRIFDVPRDGSVARILTDEQFREQPELFGKRPDGRPNRRYPNLTNPQTVQVLAEAAQEHFRANPGDNSFAFAPDSSVMRDMDAPNEGFLDMLGRWGVEEELSTSEEWFTFVNRVAEETQKQFPQAYLSTSAYANRNNPPVGVTLNDRLMVMVASIWSCNLHPYDAENCWHGHREADILRGWLDLTPNVWVYNYDFRMMTSALTPLPEVTRLRRNLPLLKEMGVLGFINETRCVWVETGIPSRYLKARLAWDVDLDVDAVLNEFYTLWYGQAAAPARGFWDDLEKAVQDADVHIHDDRRALATLYTPSLMESLEQRVAEAEAAAAADSERVQTHVRIDRLILEHLKLYVQAMEAESQGQFAEAAESFARMFEPRRALHDINPCLIWPDENGIESGVWYYGAAQRAEHYASLAARIDGTSGDLIARAGAQAGFKTDPRNDGMFQGWFKADHDVSDWDQVSTVKPFYLQGYQSEDGFPYMGYMWYRMAVDIPESAAGRTVRIACNTVEAEAWVWVNGQYVGHEPYREAWINPSFLEFDVTDALAPGQSNVVVIRVDTASNAAQAAGGIQSPVFFWASR